ncbi:hypothetical protein RJT34_20510 [Clitoria ternatea]|uniref:Uncharacterized protein n=1 Tax=Clitoria ternatea TaxID=43366 RepID=A0AAN9ISX3_CLITE
MGNACFGKKRSDNVVVHPVLQGVTIKVRMTKTQLNHMMITNANSELARLIVRECSQGRLHAPKHTSICSSQHSDLSAFSSGKSLRMNYFESLDKAI